MPSASRKVPTVVATVKCRAPEPRGSNCVGPIAASARNRSRRHETAVRGTEIRSRGQRTQRQPRLSFIQALANQFANHANEPGMRAHGFRPDHYAALTHRRVHAPGCRDRRESPCGRRRNRSVRSRRPSHLCAPCTHASSQVCPAPTTAGTPARCGSGRPVANSRGAIRRRPAGQSPSVAPRSDSPAPSPVECCARCR